jgi:hypothetical protein
MDVWISFLNIFMESLQSVSSQCSVRVTVTMLRSMRFQVLRSNRLSQLALLPNFAARIPSMETISLFHQNSRCSGWRLVFHPTHGTQISHKDESLTRSQIELITLERATGRRPAQFTPQRRAPHISLLPSIDPGRPWRRLVVSPDPPPIRKYED